MGGGHTIDGGIDYSGTSTAIDVKGNGTDVTVNGSVKSDNGQGVYGTDNTKVTVKGDVKADNVSIRGGGKSEITVEGDSVNNSSQNIYARSDSKLNVKGNVESKNGEGIRAEDNAKVTVDGNLYGGNNGISAWGDGSTDGNNIDIKIGGNVYGKTAAVDATDGVDIDIKGNVESSGSGIYSAVNNPDKDIINTINVGGNLTVTTDDGYYDYMGVGAWNNSVIDIKGTVTVKDTAGKDPWAIWSEASQVTVGAVDSDAGGIQAGGNGGKTAKIDIAGDLEAGDGYYTIQIWGSDASTVLVGNDVSAKNDGDVIIDVADAYENSEIAIGGTVQNGDSELSLKIYTDSNGNPIDVPEIVIGEIADPDKLEIYNQGWNKVSEETKREVLDNIKYIVNSNPDSMEGKGAFTITKLNGDSLSRDKSDKYDVTTKTEQILVRISVSDGYEVGSFSAGKNNTYVRNADGSYTVTVADGCGINIEALIKAIERDPDPVKPAPIDSGSGSGSSSGNSSRGGSTLTNGTWTGSGSDMTFTKADGSPVRNEWADINVNGKVNRYHFDVNGMITKGWYTDNLGVKYYFNEVLGSEYGVMCTGWKLIDGKWYYFMPYTIIRNGVSFNAGSMLHDTVTPDGYKVGTDGAWIQ